MKLWNTVKLYASALYWGPQMYLKQHRRNIAEDYVIDELLREHGITTDGKDININVNPAWWER
jgi:hypothetical protein